MSYNPFLHHLNACFSATRGRWIHAKSAQALGAAIILSAASEEEVIFVTADGTVMLAAMFENEGVRKPQADPLDLCTAVRLIHSSSESARRHNDEQRRHEAAAALDRKAAAAGTIGARLNGLDLTSIIIRKGN